MLTGRILDSECAGVSGAVVDVWYAGGGETRSKNNAVACKHITHILEATASLLLVHLSQKLIKFL